jgi:hypothetical protein
MRAFSFTVLRRQPMRLKNEACRALKITVLGSTVCALVALIVLTVLPHELAKLQLEMLEFSKFWGYIAAAGGAICWCMNCSSGIPANTVTRSWTRTGNSTGDALEEAYNHLDRTGTSSPWNDFPR